MARLSWKVMLPRRQRKKWEMISLKSISIRSYRILNHHLIILGFFFLEGLNHRSIFDKSVPVKQLDVVEAHNLLIFRCDKGTEIYQMHIKYIQLLIYKISVFFFNINVLSSKQVKRERSTCTDWMTSKERCWIKLQGERQNAGKTESRKQRVSEDNSFQTKTTLNFNAP